jgi:hypothetical protein
MRRTSAHSKYLVQRVHSLLGSGNERRKVAVEVECMCEQGRLKYKSEMKNKIRQNLSKVRDMRNVVNLMFTALESSSANVDDIVVTRKYVVMCKLNVVILDFTSSLPNSHQRPIEAIYGVFLWHCDICDLVLEIINRFLAFAVVVAPLWSRLGSVNGLLTLASFMCVGPVLT